MLGGTLDGSAFFLSHKMSVVHIYSQGEEKWNIMMTNLFSPMI